MATTKTSAMPSAQGAAAPRAQSNRRLVIFMLLQLILVAGVSVGATWLIMNRLSKQADSVAVAAATAATAAAQGKPIAAEVALQAAAATTAEVPEPIFYELEPFTVTVENSVTERILHVGLTLRLLDEASRERLERYKPEVRSRVLLALSQLDPEDLKGAQGRTALAARLVELLKRPFAPQPLGQQISDVLFTSFVVQ